MSAFEKVNEAKELISSAQKAYQAQKEKYDNAVKGACEAIAADDIGLARKHLDSIGFAKSGEDPVAYMNMLYAAVHVKGSFTIPPSANLKTWDFVTENLPVDAAAGMKGFFGDVLRKGSPEILSYILPLYKEAGENWHYNWNAGLLLQPPYSFVGKEDQLLDRLKCVDILLDAGCPPERLTEVLHRIPQYANESAELGLSEKTLDAMSEIHTKVARKHIAENQTRFLNHEEYNLVPPENLPKARAAYFEMQIEILGESSEPKPRSRSTQP